MTLGDKLAKLRKENNYTQEQLAEILGVSRQAISKWESNAAYPETEKLIRLGKLYNCSMDYLLMDEEQREPKREAVQKIELTALCYERISKKKIGNLPLWHVNIGFGRVATGIFAVGLASKGIVSVGLASVGVVSFGLLSVGLLALGSLAVGLIAAGAIAVGLLALGAIAVGVFGIGALAIGQFAIGAAALGKYAALGDSATAAIAIGITEARGEQFHMLSGSLRAWQENSDAVRMLLEETVPWYLTVFKNLFLWFCRFI